MRLSGCLYYISIDYSFEMTIEDRPVSVRTVDDAAVGALPPTPEAEKQILEMRERVSKLNLEEPLMNWADDNCLYRYLRARSYNVDKAMAMFENSVKWRREFGIQKLLVDYLPDIKSEGCVLCHAGQRGSGAGYVLWRTKVVSAVQADVSVPAGRFRGRGACFRLADSEARLASARLFESCHSFAGFSGPFRSVLQFP